MKCKENLNNMYMYNGYLTFSCIKNHNMRNVQVQFTNW